MNQRVLSRNAFTLVEIMLALAIAGIIMAAGIAPLMYTLRMINATRDNFALENRERTASNRIYQDIREAVMQNSSTPLRITSDASPGSSAQSLLIVWTKTPSRTFMPMRSVIWGVPRKTVLDEDFEEGLYRWVLSEDIQPDAVKIDELKASEAALMLRGVKEVSFAVLQDSSWEEKYEGATPKALRVSFRYGTKDVVYEEILPNLQ
jgi:prepilin-type N-terminal cleavage/methylation domain-containing protein